LAFFLDDVEANAKFYENHLAFTVEDIDGECKILTNQGIEI